MDRQIKSLKRGIRIRDKNIQCFKKETLKGKALRQELKTPVE
jgi:hypothetical protein